MLVDKGPSQEMHTPRLIFNRNVCSVFDLSGAVLKVSSQEKLSVTVTPRYLLPSMTSKVCQCRVYVDWSCTDPDNGTLARVEAHLSIYFPLF